MNMSLNNWYSKKLSTIETSAFGAELVAMKVRVDTLHAIQYKVRMFGIPISDASYVYGDNILVIHNTSKPESTPKEMCNTIAYHAIHKSVAMVESLTGHIRSEDNLAGLLTKIVNGQKQKHLVSLVLYDKYDGET